ncbi:kinase domain-containing protein [Colletotrichum navitas]|uniref:EKC/KEOPS complex subunit BUD32 n=1 Tax=Colletotrichum navitas TaxID=681940 RepID=A0AAD8PIZ9_9PEZI|nr:kinase domain-containing protein [Colletotrichum navitas]KAK1561713.1 kinase domain-containing protein [Colletotrichum navitas]
MNEPRWRGSSSNIYEFEPGKVLKVPREVPLTNDGHDVLNRDRAKGFEVERGIYEALGKNKLILPFYGCREFEGRQGLLLAQADSNLQENLEDGLATVTMDERKRWCCEAVDVIAYIHNRGVVHSDLRPENFLVHGRDIWLSDFNGSVCKERDLDGEQLPDAGFWNLKFETTPATDIFALGSVLYAIVTGWWPFCKPGVTDRLNRKNVQYDEQVTERFERGHFPDVSSLWGGDIIMGCWTDKYKSAADVKRDMDLAMLSMRVD